MKTEAEIKEIDNRLFLERARQRAKNRRTGSDRLNNGEKLKDGNEGLREMISLLAASKRRDLLLYGFLLLHAIENAITRVRVKTPAGPMPIEFDPDVIEALQNSVLLVLERFPKNEQNQLSFKVDRDAVFVLRNAGNEDPRKNVLAVCQLVLQAVDQGNHPVPFDQTVLCSTALFDMAVNDDPEKLWGYEEHAVNRTARRILEQARTRGYL